MPQLLFSPVIVCLTTNAVVKTTTANRSHRILTGPCEGVQMPRHASSHPGLPTGMGSRHQHAKINVWNQVTAMGAMRTRGHEGYTDGRAIMPIAQASGKIWCYFLPLVPQQTKIAGISNTAFHHFTLWHIPIFPRPPYNTSTVSQELQK